MEKDTLQLSAYHEAGRVVTAYLCGYACDAMNLPGSGAGAGSKLNSGNDLAIVQAVFSGSPPALPAEAKEHGIEVARKLMTIYCAGTCSEIYFQNNASVPDELEMEIPGQDLVNIEKIQSFLSKAIADHPEDYPMRVIASVFGKLKYPDVWKAIELLAAKLMASESRSLNRFYIEDTLMVAGIQVRRATASGPSYGIGVHEDTTPRAKPQAEVQEPKTETFSFGSTNPLDAMVMDFLHKIKKDWRQGEIDAAKKYLDEIYRKYGG